MNRREQKLDPVLAGGRLVATALGACALIVAAGFFVRTRAVVGPVVRKELAEWAERHGADLRVADLRPAGLVGVRLEDVRLRWSRDRMRVDLEAAAVDVVPSVGDLLVGRVAVDRFRIADGRVTVDPRIDGSEAVRGEGASRTGAPAGEADGRSSGSQTRARGPLAGGFGVELKDVDLRVAAGSTVRTAPVDLRQVELGVEGPAEGLRVVRAEGYGRFSGGVSFSVSSRRSSDDRNGGARIFEFHPQQPVSMASLVGREFPAELRIGGASLCPTCARPRVCLRRLSAARGPWEVRTAGGCIERHPEELRMRFDAIEGARGDTELPVRLTNLRGSLSSGGARVRASARGPELGEASLSARWRRTERVAMVRARTSGFRLGPIWSALEIDETISGGVVDGRLEATIDPIADLVTTAGDVRLREAVVRHPFLDDEPIEIDASRWHVDAFTDFALEHVGLADTRVTLGDLRPVSFTGSAVDAGRGWSFEMRAKADEVSAPKLVDALPSRIALPAVGAEMRGQFRASLYSAGHTAYPDSLRLEVDVGGDVRVLRESPRVDVPSLALTGPPGPAVSDGPVGEIPLSKWVNLRGLPDRLPRVLLAAEDVHFYRHSGFDWSGIRNAMEHNLRVDRLERGGSTISQQVAKNLFFTHRRTLSRKIKEVWATWRLESELSKDRILELYLNLAQWGPGVQGLHEASEFYFRRTPEELTVAQMTLLSAIIPGPERYGDVIERGFLPSSRVEKVEHILSNLRYLGIIDHKTYDRVYGEALRGRIGGLDLTVCRDDRHALPSAPACPYGSRG